jgi:bla regulator protein blaR1
MSCVFYVFTITIGLGSAAALLDYALPQRFARRWLWFGTLVVSVVAVPLSLLHVSAGVVRILGVTIATLGRSATPHDGGLSRVLAWSMSGEPFQFVVVPVWAMATTILVIVGIVQVWAISRELTTGTARTIDGRAVVLSDSMGPGAVQYPRPTILLPRWVLALTETERRFIIRHEAEHIERKDGALLFCATAAVVLLPWIVPLWWQLRRLRLAIETDCDRRVVDALGHAAAYGALLLRVSLAHGDGVGPQPSFVGRRGSLERRLVCLLEPPRRRTSGRVAGALLALALAVAVLTMPHPRGHAHSLHRPPTTRARL